MPNQMLWYDNENTQTAAVKIQRAAQYYKSKYGDWPALCFVHPAMLADGPVVVEGVEIKTTNSVLPNHFWLSEKTS